MLKQIFNSQKILIINLTSIVLKIRKTTTRSINQLFAQLKIQIKLTINQNQVTNGI